MSIYGRNPMKHLATTRIAKPVTLTTVSHIPLLQDYWAESLDILRLCLDSMRVNSGPDADIAVFDNGSCAAVRDYLVRELEAKRIQYLVLCDANVSKLAAQDYLFHAAPGEYVGYTDSDVLFFPGWLEDSLACMDAFPWAGMVCGRPWRPMGDGDRRILHQTRERARALGVSSHEGDLIDPAVLEEHTRSLGCDTPPVLPPAGDLLLERNGVKAFGFGSHFQFLTRRSVIREVGRLGRTETGDGNGVRVWDERISELGYLRLAIPDARVYHLGNSLRGEDVVGLLDRAGVGDTNVTAPSPVGDLPLMTRCFKALIRVPLLRKGITRLQRHAYDAIYIH